MDIKNPYDLKMLAKVVDLCRKKGVKVFKIDNIEITLSEDAPVTRTRKAKNSTIPATSKYPDAPFESDSLTDEQLLFYSAGDTTGSETIESN